MPLFTADFGSLGSISLDDTLPVYDGEPYSALDKRVVEAARISFAAGVKDHKRDAKLINFMMKMNHSTPFEHVHYTYRVTCPLFVAVHFLRHRTFSFNMVSRRYTSEDLQFHIPSELRLQAITNRQASQTTVLDENAAMALTARIGGFTASALKLYHRLLDAGVCREQARMVLPQSMLTSFVMTADLHNLLKFISLRNHPDAQKETAQFAAFIESTIAHTAPTVYSAYVEHVKGDNT